MFRTAKCLMSGSLDSSRAASSAGSRVSSAPGTQSVPGSAAGPRWASRSVWGPSYGARCWPAWTWTRSPCTARTSSSTPMGRAVRGKRAPSDRQFMGRPDLQAARGRGPHVHSAGALALIWPGGRRTGRPPAAAGARPSLGSPGAADGSRLQGRPHAPPGNCAGLGAIGPVLVQPRGSRS